MFTNYTVLPAFDVADVSFPFYYSPRPNLFEFISDSNLSLLAPVVAYWAYSLIFVLFDFAQWSWLERYRLHEPAEITARNRATMSQVIRAVLIQQVIQTAFGYFWVVTEPDNMNHGQAMQRLYATLTVVFKFLLNNNSLNRIMQLHGVTVVSWLYWWIIPAFQFLFAIFIMDTWEYFLHRLFHTNKFLYRHFHSVHHRLYVPYAFGALYNHWFEGLLLDIVGAGIAHGISFMTIRQGIFLFTFSTIKTVDDHCGYALPFDPLQWLFPNNATYHDVHHQAWGIKYNFSQPFYVHWDTILGTKHDGRTRRKGKDKDI